MPISSDHSRALLRDPNIPTADLVVWGDDPRPESAATPPARALAAPRTPIRAYVGIATTAAFVLGVGVMGASAGPETPRLAPPGCIFHTVKSGDTVFRIAGRAGVTLDVVARLNPAVTNLNKIWPGDQIATSCGANDVGLIEPKAINEVQRATADNLAQYREQTETCMGDLDRDKIIEPYTCWTWPAIVVALHDNGARGDDLVTLAATSPGESGRAVDPCETPESCDRTLIKDGWGQSACAMQVRTVIKETGKGTTRDIERVTGSLNGCAQSAVELCHQSKERGKPCGQPWSAWLAGFHKSYMAPVAKTVAELGLS